MGHPCSQQILPPVAPDGLCASMFRLRVPDECVITPLAGICRSPNHCLEISAAMVALLGGPSFRRSGIHVLLRPETGATMATLGTHFSQRSFGFGEIPFRGVILHLWGTRSRSIGTHRGGGNFSLFISNKRTVVKNPSKWQWPAPLTSRSPAVRGGRGCSCGRRTSRGGRYTTAKDSCHGVVVDWFGCKFGKCSMHISNKTRM